MPIEGQNHLGGYGSLPRSGTVSVGNAAGTDKSINVAKDKSTSGSTSHNTANSSLRALHDWFYSNAFITQSNASGTSQSNVSMSEFYRAQVLTADFHGSPETPSTYQTNNNARVRIYGHVETMVPDGSGDKLYYFSTNNGGSFTLQTNNPYINLYTGDYGTRTSWLKDGVTGRAVVQGVYTGYGGGDTHYWDVQARATNPN